MGVRRHIRRGRQLRTCSFWKWRHARVGMANGRRTRSIGAQRHMNSMQAITGCLSRVMHVVVAPPVAKLAADLPSIGIDKAAGVDETRRALAIHTTACIVVLAKRPAGSGYWLRVPWVGRSRPTARTGGIPTVAATSFRRAGVCLVAANWRVLPCDGLS